MGKGWQPIGRDELRLILSQPGVSLSPTARFVVGSSIIDLIQEYSVGYDSETWLESYDQPTATTL